jgi:hypothetical protein
MSINLSALMKQRYDTAANWTAQNPTLLAGEIGIESDTKKWKVGTGATAWTSLVYAIGGTYPIVNADIAAAAAIVDTKLATIATAGKVSNSATTAASANTASAIVARDASGNFTAGTITAALTGAASANVLKAGDTMTGVLAVTAGTAALPGIAVSGDPNTGIYSPGADQLAISTNGTEKLIVKSDGKVGIGDSAPDANSQLHIVGSSYQPLYVNTTAAGGGGAVFFRSGTQALYAGTAGSSWLTGSSTADALVRSEANLIFATGGNNQRAQIDSSGRLLVGTIASPAHQLQVSTDSAGKPSTNTWTIVSDERIKEEIQLADLDLCYQAVKNIPLKRFKWKDEVYTEEQVRDRRKLGWIAQDVEAVFPKAVGTYGFKYNQVFEETIIPAVEEVLDDEGNVITPAQPERIEKGELISEDVIEDCRDLNSDQIYAAMYGAIQKLMVKVETLEAEVALLKAA